MPIRSDEARIRRNHRRWSKRRNEREVQWNYRALKATSEELARLPKCEACGAPITESRRSTRRYCWNKCRQKAYRERERGMMVEHRAEEDKLRFDVPQPAVRAARG